MKIKTSYLKSLAVVYFNLYLCNCKRFPGFHKAMVTRVEVLQNEKSCGNTSRISYKMNTQKIFRFQVIQVEFAW